MPRKLILMGRLITFLALTATATCWAREVTETEVRTAAENLLASGRLEQVLPNATIREVIAAGEIWYVQLNPSGHLILSGGTRTVPLLGYSESDYVAPAEGDLQEVLQGALRARVASAEAATTAVVRTASVASTLTEAEAKWEALLNPTTSRAQVRSTDVATVVGPLLDSTWDQCAPWNDLTPQHTAFSYLAKLTQGDVPYSGRIAVGCVVTAYSQILRYHGWPARVDETLSQKLKVAYGPFNTNENAGSSSGDGSEEGGSEGDGAEEGGSEGGSEGDGAGTNEEGVEEDLAMSTSGVTYEGEGEGTEAPSIDDPKAPWTKYEMRFHGGLPLEWNKIASSYDYRNLTEGERFHVARLGLFCDILAEMGFDAKVGGGTLNFKPISNVWYQFGKFDMWDGAKGVITNGKGEKSYLTDERVQDCLTSLDAKLPILVSLVEPAHTIVMDGYVRYGGEVYFHLNFGWGGDNNKLYRLYLEKGSITYDSLATGHAPKQMAQVTPLPKVVSLDDTDTQLMWTVPRCWKYAFTAFDIAATKFVEKTETWDALTSVETFGVDVNAGIFSVGPEATEGEEDGEGVSYIAVTSPVDVPCYSYYNFAEPFIPTEDSVVSLTYDSSMSDGQMVAVEIWSEADPQWVTLGELQSVKAPAGITGEALSYDIGEKYDDNTFCRLRLCYRVNLDDDNEEENEEESQKVIIYKLYDLQVSNVLAQEEPTVVTVKNEEPATTYAMNVSNLGLEEAGRYWISVKPYANSTVPYLDALDAPVAGDSKPCAMASTFTTVVDTNTTEAVDTSLPEILAIEAASEDGLTSFESFAEEGEESIRPGLLTGPLFGPTEFRVACSENVAGLEVLSSCPTLIPDANIKVEKDETVEGNVFKVSITSEPDELGLPITEGKSTEDLDGTRMLLTLTARTKAGNEVYHEVIFWLRSYNYISQAVEDLEGQPTIIEIPFDWFMEHGLLNEALEKLGVAEGDEPTDEQMREAVASVYEADPDEDGFPSWQEYFCGTDPTNTNPALPQSPRIKELIFEEGQLHSILYEPMKGASSFSQAILQGKVTLDPTEEWQSHGKGDLTKCRFFRVIVVPYMGDSDTH